MEESAGLTNHYGRFAKVQEGSSLAQRRKARKLMQAEEAAIKEYQSHEEFLFDDFEIDLDDDDMPFAGDRE